MSFSPGRNSLVMLLVARNENMKGGKEKAHIVEDEIKVCQSLFGN